MFSISSLTRDPEWAARFYSHRALPVEDFREGTDPAVPEPFHIVAERLHISRSPRDPETEARPFLGGERPGNRRRMCEIAVTSALDSVTVPTNETSTRKMESAGLKQAGAA